MKDWYYIENSTSGEIKIFSSSWQASVVYHSEPSEWFAPRPFNPT